MSDHPFFQTLRKLARSYQTFECFAAHDIRHYNVTPAQFDILATLGNTQGMTPKQLSEKTLITKGTLTGVVDRLVNKQLVERQPSAADRRSVLVVLTQQGQQLFDTIFPAHVRTLQQAFSHFKAADYQTINQALDQLQSVFEQPPYSSQTKRGH